VNNQVSPGQLLRAGTVKPSQQKQQQKLGTGKEHTGEEVHYSARQEKLEKESCVLAAKKHAKHGKYGKQNRSTPSRACK